MTEKPFAPGSDAVNEAREAGTDPTSRVSRPTSSVAGGRRRWRLRDGDRTEALRASGYPPLVQRLLANRGISTVAAARAFLEGKPGSPGDPFSLPDMQAAVERVGAALKDDELVAVFGDFDVDGVTAAALLTEGIESLGGRGLARLRRRIGIVPQEPRLVPDRTVLGNVTVVLRALGMGRSAARTRAWEALRSAGLGAKPNALPAELALGERQQLAVARAMATAPDLVLADEPFAAGDEAPVAALLRAIHAQGTTVLIATRAARLAGELGARLLTLEAGRLGGAGGLPGHA